MTKPQTPSKVGDSQSISRAAAVLRVIADHPGSSLGEIAKATGLARSTVQRIVGSLNSEGFLSKTFGQQGVYLGMELARLGAKVNIDARALMRPLMEDLHARIGDNIDMTTLSEGRVFVIEQIASNEAIRVMSHVGKEHPIHCTANGKAHLGMLDESEARALLAGPLERLTENTVTDADALMAQVEAARNEKLYVDREEFSQDACAIATALPPIGGRDYAVSVAMPSARFERREGDVRSALSEFRETVRATYGMSI